MEVNKRTLEAREGKGFEIQWYDDKGDYSHVTQVDTIEELAMVLSRSCWGSVRWGNNPTIYYNGKKFCHCEYSDYTQM